jgi:thiosulfate dehydrogenase [quinone] large subunit
MTRNPMSMTNDLATGRAARWTTLLLRCAVAYLWLENLDWKRPPFFGANDRSGLWAFTNGAIEYPVWDPFSAVITSLIIPNFGPFGWGVYLAEIALGVFLLLGLATRFWALVGVVQSFVIYLTIGAQPHEWPWTYVLMMLAHLALFTLAAGRVAGVDAVLRRRLPADGSGSRWRRLLLAAT